MSEHWLPQVCVMLSKRLNSPLLHPECLTMACMTWRLGEGRRVTERSSGRHWKRHESWILRIGCLLQQPILLQESYSSKKPSHELPLMPYSWIVQLASGCSVIWHDSPAYPHFLTSSLCVLLTSERKMTSEQAQNISPNLRTREKP